MPVDFYYYSAIIRLKYLHAKTYKKFIRRIELDALEEGQGRGC